MIKATKAQKNLKIKPDFKLKDVIEIGKRFDVKDLFT